MKKTAIVLATALSVVMGAGAHAEEKKVRIGVTLFGLSEFMANISQGLQDHPAVKEGKVEVTVLDGRFDAQVQANQIDTLITQHVDAIIFAPIDADAAAAPIQRANAAGIPVITAVTNANSDLVKAAVAPEDKLGGQLIAEEMVKRIGGKGNVVIQEGPIGNSPQILRREGIDEVLAKHPDIKVLAAKTANWSRAEGLANMENWLSLYGDSINGVIAQNDEMGLGSLEAIKAKGLTTEQIKIVSIDGISDAIRAVKQSDIFTLWRSPKMESQAALDLAMHAVVGDSYKPASEMWTVGKVDWKNGAEKYYPVPWYPVDKSNVAKFE